MNKLAFAVVFVAGIPLYFLTPPDALFAGAIAGICWGLGGVGFING